MGGLKTKEAARRLGTSTTTVNALLSKQRLTGVQQARGSRFSWEVDADSVERFLAEHGRYDAQPRRQTRLTALEAELSSLRHAVQALLAEGQPPRYERLSEVERVRDDLQARMVNLEDALTRAHAVAELQSQADAERAAVIEHLLSAAAANERADALRRQALNDLQEALAGFTRPGYPGQIG